MNCWIYVPHPDMVNTPYADNLGVRAQKKEEGEIPRKNPDRQKRVILCDMTQAEPLRNVANGDRVQVLIHGSRRRARLVGARDPNTRQWRVFTAQDLAQKMTDDGLEVDRQVEIRLFTCWAGEPRSYWFNESIPFGGQLYAALRRMGHRNHTVIGYRGSMKLTPYDAPHKLVSKGFGHRDLKRDDAHPESRYWQMEDGRAVRFTKRGFAIASTRRVVFDSTWYHTHCDEVERYFR